MSDYNLIDEPWISVVVDYKGTTKLVGLKEFFEHAHEYIALAGDMPTQDFAVMRFLLAILHTVFSRYDAHGEPYEMIELNDRMQQIEKVDLEDEEDYEDALMETWRDLWNAKKFPEIVVKYLDAWHDRFYLFDDKYPFYQVTKEEIENIDSKFADNTDAKATIKFRSMNRTISESGNKATLFSPKIEENKDLLSNAELARWLITFQGVSNASDKKTINKIEGKSIGWIYNLGGVFLSSDNIFKTLMLNLILRHDDSQYNNIQNPCWEKKPETIYNEYLKNKTIDNVSELYTNWSRLVYYFPFKPKKSEIKQNMFRIVKTNSIPSENNFLEPMTIWKYYDKKYTPPKYKTNKAAWRSFGSFLNVNEDVRMPGVISHLNDIKKFIDESEVIQINAISAIDNNDASSRTMINEFYDYFDLGLFIVNDLQSDGWIARINDIVDKTKDVVEKIYRAFLNDIAKIRGIESGAFTSSSIESMYFKIDKPFRDWLTNINYDDNKDEKEQIWNKELKNLVIRQAKIIIEQASPKDFTGIIENDSVKNIVTAYNNLMSNINKKL